VRNDLWTAWLRRPARSAARESLRLLRGADRRAAVAGVGTALLGAPWIVRERRVVPPHVEEWLTTLERPAPPGP